MPVTNIEIPVDNDIKNQAQDIFVSLGLDMTSAINIFLKQAVRHRGIPFDMGTKPSKKTPQLGCMKGQIWMADDFDAPLEDFREYME
jgi:DNA-damage-inducible protein J